jgi:hypothetical protein
MNAEITQMKTKHYMLPTYCWNEVNEPGCYYFVDWGFIARVPKDGVAEGRSPKITFFWGNESTVCKLSDDPYICISKARQIAADHDYPVNF